MLIFLINWIVRRIIFVNWYICKHKHWMFYRCIDFCSISLRTMSAYWRSCHKKSLSLLLFFLIIVVRHVCGPIVGFRSCSTCLWWSWKYSKWALTFWEFGLSTGATDGLMGFSMSVEVSSSKGYINRLFFLFVPARCVQTFIQSILSMQYAPGFAIIPKQHSQ